MAVWTSRYENKSAADQYFASINPMAARIIESKHKHIQKCGKEKWNNMSVEEQAASLDNFFTSQVNCRNRGDKARSQLPPYVKSIFPKLIVETGQVEIFLNNEDDSPIYKDEHSAPFCWETQSQMNLPIPSPTRERKKSTSSVTSVGKAKKLLIPFTEKFKNKKKTNGHSKTKPQKKSTGKKNEQRPKERKISTGKKENTETDFTPTLYKDYLYQKNAKKIDDTKVIVEEPRPIKTPPSVKLRGSSQSNSNPTEVDSQPRRYDLPTKDHNKTMEFQKSKPSTSTRINPRASLTLDGAIRNLEVAIKQEKQQSFYTGSQIHDPILTKKKYEINDNEESPLLNSQSSGTVDFPTSFNKEKDSSSVRKSGFDFLDDW